MLFTCSTSPRARDSSSIFPPHAIPLSPRTSTEISAYPPSHRPSSFFQSPRAQSCPSSPQTSRSSFADASSSPSSSLARLQLTSPRSSGRYHRKQGRGDNSPHDQATHSIPAVFKVPNAFPYERSPSTRRSLQKTLRAEENRGFRSVRHVRSSSCDSRPGCRIRSSFDPKSYAGQEEAIYRNDRDNDGLRGGFSKFQQDRMEISEFHMPSQRDRKHDSSHQVHRLVDYPPPTSREPVSRGQRSRPQCSSEKPSDGVTLRNIRDTCKNSDSDRGDHWRKPVYQCHKNSPRGQHQSSHLQSTPRRRNCKLVLDTSLSTINPNIDSSSDDDEVDLI